MADQIGVVTEKQDGGWAIVVSDRKGACSGCHSGDGCHSCLSGLSTTKMQSRAINPINAHVGDVVKIHLRSSDLFKGAFVLYLIPAICLMGGALTGAEVAASRGWGQTATTVLAAALGLIMGMGLVMMLDRSRYIRQRMRPTIVEVMAPAESAPGPLTPPSCCT